MRVAGACHTLEIIVKGDIMKKSVGLACCSLLLGFGVESAMAQPVTVQVTGHIVGLSDSTNQIAPLLTLFEPVTATYTYDTVEPISPYVYAYPSVVYAPPATQTNFTVNAGPFTFQTGSSSRFQVQVSAGVPNSMEGNLILTALGNPPLPNGIPVDDISFNFFDPTGQWPTSTAPPAGPPLLTSFANSQITVSGPMNQNYFQVSIQVDSVGPIPPVVSISPATGRFLPQQHFDAAVWLPATGAAIATMQASVGGVALTLSYPGTCQLAPANSSAQPALLCPGADAALTSLQGLTQIDWLVTFADGSSVTQSVQWNLVR
jgi:hypothetical protein